MPTEEGLTGERRAESEAEIFSTSIKNQFKMNFTTIKILQMSFQEWETRLTLQFPQQLGGRGCQSGQSLR